MFQICAFSACKYEYLTISLCGYAPRPHGSFTRPYKTDQTDTVTR